MGEVSNLYKTIFSKEIKLKGLKSPTLLDIYYHDLIDFEGEISLTKEGYQSFITLNKYLLQKGESGISRIDFLRLNLLPSCNSNDMQNKVKLALCVLRENTIYYGAKSIDNTTESLNTSCSYLYEYSFYAINEAVEEFISPKSTGDWDRDTQEYKKPQYNCPALGELRSRSATYHSKGLQFIRNCEFIIKLYENCSTNG